MRRHPWSLVPLAVVLMVASTAPCVAVAQTPSIIYYRFTPMVVLQSRTAPVTLEVKTANSPSAVTLELQAGSVVSLADDGVGVDAVAGDGVYSIALRASAVLYDFGGDDVNRNYVGKLRLYQGTTPSNPYNVFIDVLTPDVPLVTVTQVSPAVQYSEHLVNVFDPAFFPTGSLPTSSSTIRGAKAIAQTFYAALPDVYDFLNIISELGVPRNGGHVVIYNNVANIGTFMGSSPDPVVGGPAAWGSAGRLSGVTIFPHPTRFDGANWGYLHERGHQWINQLDLPPLGPQRGAHWPLSDLATDIMGYELAPDYAGLRLDADLIPSGPDYRVERNNRPKTYSDLSLYLMGLAAPAEVQDHFVFDDQSQPVDALLHGPVTTVSISAVIAAMGPRTPAYGAAPTKFRVGTILVSRDGLLSADVMQLYDYFSARAEGLSAVPVHEGLLKELSNPFAPATRGRGRLDHRIMHRLLVDASRDGGTWWAPQGGPFNPAAHHQGKRLADYLRSKGYLVDELPRPSTITSALLQPYDIVIRAGGFGSYTPEEISAYQSYVQLGGRLLLLADHVANAPADGVAQSFGIQFGAVTRGANKLARYAAHPITTGLGTVSYQVGSAVLAYRPLARLVGSLSWASYLDLNNNGMWNAGEPWGPAVMGVFGSGKGRIVFCGDVGLWENVPQPLLGNVLAWFEGP